ncbi:MAG: sensor histidine kinase [Spirochaetales bacterium]|nr:sensor histidine kinase [Spirochaetales bacterium]
MRPIPFRLFLLYLAFLVTLTTTLISGVSIFMIRYKGIGERSRKAAEEAVDVLASSAEDILSAVENSIFLLARSSLQMEHGAFGELLDGSVALTPMIRAVYLLDERGMSIAVGTHDPRPSLHEDFVGIDFSNMPLFNALDHDDMFVWSDKFLSILSGDTSIGLGFKTGTAVVIAELSLDALMRTFGSISQTSTRVWVIDRLGELVADSGMSSESGIINVRTIDFMSKAMEQKELDTIVQFNGTQYHPAWAFSEKLGWLFIIGVPAGSDNILIKSTITDLILFSLSFIIVALILIPILSMQIFRDVQDLRNLALNLAENGEIPAQKQNRIREFNSIRLHLHDMHAQIREREDKLKLVNQTLEKMVDDRTRALTDRNNELQATLGNLKQVQEVAMRSEKLAALGRLVAGIAHELNTPIGNTLMAVTSIKDRQEALEQEKAFSDRERFEKFTRHLKTGLQIAELNIQKVAELVNGFKHVANDQTSSVRRTFDLNDTIDDVLLTLSPMLKRSPHSLKTRIAEGIIMDSFPGTIGQILTNLITNALTHAWDEGQKGKILVRAEPVIPGTTNGDTAACDWVRVSVQDNGRGIPESIGQQVFEPFFTTRMGKGGTGLGLNIAHNGARNILGGILDFHLNKDGGVTFFLDMPVRAPEL